MHYVQNYISLGNINVFCLMNPAKPGYSQLENKDRASVIIDFVLYHSCESNVVCQALKEIKHLRWLTEIDSGRKRYSKCHNAWDLHKLDVLEELSDSEEL
jgi:hypothetical protein